MPMSGAVLGPAIASMLTGLTDAEKASPNAIWTKISNLIVAHIQSQGVVTTTGTAAAQTGTIT